MPKAVVLIILLVSLETAWAQIASDSFAVRMMSTNTTSMGCLTLGTDDSTASNTIERESSIHVWLKAGIGNSRFGFTNGASLNASFTSNLFSIKYVSASDEQMFGVERTGAEPNLEFEEVGILYGRLYREKGVSYSLSAGLGLVNGVDRGMLIGDKRYERIDFAGVSVPFEGSVRVEIWHFGVGFSLFGTINSNNSFLGWLAELHIEIV